MSSFKAFPELSIAPEMAEGAFLLQTAKGEVIAHGNVRSKADAERLLECWNAVRKIAFPQAHIDATEDYVQRLERLRREAVAAAQQAGSSAGWNHDMSAAPRDPNVKLLVADADGSSPRESRWIPAKLTTSGRLMEGDRWSGYSRGKQPAAWMPWPESPFESPRKAAEAGSESDGSAVGRPTSERRLATAGSEDGGVTGGERAATHSPILATETMGGTGDDCSFGNRGAWPPQGGASSSRGNDSLSVVTAGETASFIIHHHIFLDDVGSGA